MISIEASYCLPLTKPRESYRDTAVCSKVCFVFLPLFPTLFRNCRSLFLPPTPPLSFFISLKHSRTPINLCLPCLKSHISLLLHFRHFTGVNRERETKASQVTVVLK